MQRREFIRIIGGSALTASVAPKPENADVNLPSKRTKYPIE